MREFRSLKQNSQRVYAEVQYENQATISRGQSASSSAPVMQQVPEGSHVQNLGVGHQDESTEYSAIDPLKLRSRVAEVKTAPNEAYGY